MNENNLEALKARVAANDPEAMYAYAETVRQSDQAEYNKYIRLAAQLGHPAACEKLGDKYMAAGNYDAAAHYYRLGAKAGRQDCSVKLALIHLSFDEITAIKELEELAESGVKSACSALAAYYKALGNRKQYNFWNSLAK